MARGHIRDRSGPKGPAFELRIYGGTDPATGVGPVEAEVTSYLATWAGPRR